MDAWKLISDILKKPEKQQQQQQQRKKIPEIILYQLIRFSINQRKKQKKISIDGGHIDFGKTKKKKRNSKI